MTVGIIGAMAQEVDAIVSLLDSATTFQMGSRVFTTGKFGNQEIVVVFSRWGKVASASTATLLINQFQAKQIIFTGLAGAVDHQLNVGDIVVGDKCIQHDLDGRPFFSKFEIPLTSKTYLHSSVKLVQVAFNAVKKFLTEDFTTDVSEQIRHKFEIKQPTVQIGTVASGDQFISCNNKLNELRDEIDNILAVEMEGAAVSQVCSEFDIPFVVIRTISDKANAAAPIDFNAFLSEVTPYYAKGVMRHVLRNLA